jgi:hypothetical protein
VVINYKILSKNMPERKPKKINEIFNPLISQREAELSVLYHIWQHPKLGERLPTDKVEILSNRTIGAMEKRDKTHGWFITGTEERIGYTTYRYFFVANPHSIREFEPGKAHEELLFPFQDK